jgi:DNA-binding NarL/FixJ family response regulator
MIPIGCSRPSGTAFAYCRHRRKPGDPTDREREVLEFGAQGANNDAIAKKLRIAEKIVRNHVSTMLAKQKESFGHVKPDLADA